MFEDLEENSGFNPETVSQKQENSYKDYGRKDQGGSGNQGNSYGGGNSGPITLGKSLYRGFFLFYSRWYRVMYFQRSRDVRRPRREQWL